jgi:eukaryotic-like serine/threonine-protein kinase
MPEVRERLQKHLSGSYTLGRELTGGGMSRVFVADDPALGRAVVVKVLPPDLAAGLNTQRFKREIMLAAQLQHPHIVPVLSAGIADDLPYFVMPFVAGQSLRQALGRADGLSIAETVSILRDVARALAYAHEQGVVHRDIKPDNVLLSGGSAVVTDFGIAKAISSAALATPGETLTQVGTSLGTPTYMSPEQAAGDPNADARSDFYSFGVMAYEMVAGRPPFFDRPGHALIMAHIAEPPEPIERLVPSLPPRLAQLIMRCLAKSPADRPQSAKEVLHALDDLDFTGQTHVTAPHVRAADGTILNQQAVGLKPGKSRRFAMAAGLTAVVLLVAAFVGKRFFDRNGAASLDPHSVAVVPFRVASADPSHHYLREGMVDLIAAKLSSEDLRAIEPRTALDAWRSAGGTETQDLSREATILLAQRLGSGKALLGDVVGTPNRLTLTLSLLSVPNGNQVARVSVEGPPDSLATLVDRVAAQLLTQTSGESPARLSTLSGTSLPALRAYLDGQARLRRGEAQNAAKDFERALKEDSTFALAGLGLRMATSWYGDGNLGNRGLQIALREKARLSQRDQMLLEAVAGPRYPDHSTHREVYQARERFLSNDPNNAEAWYLLADHIFHAGPAMGIADWEERALAGFKKAMELDSLYLPGYNHALPLAPSLGDTAFTSRATRLRMANDTSTGWRLVHEWYMAVRRGDKATADSIFRTRGKIREEFLASAVRHTLFDGTGAEYVKRAVEEIVAESPTDAIRRSRQRYAHDIMLNLGRPAEALRYLRASVDTGVDHNAAIIMVRDATVGEGSIRAGEEGARILSPIELRQPRDSLGREVQRGAVRAMEVWRLSRGDTTRTRASLDVLRSLIPTAPKTGLLALQIEIALIETLHADVARSPALRATAERLDSLIQSQDVAGFHSGRAANAALETARIFEGLGDVRRARTALGRFSVWNTDSMPYLGLQLRHLGRLSAANGDARHARRIYEHYLRLRSLAEPSLRPQIDSVRAELAALGR